MRPAQILPCHLFIDFQSPILCWLSRFKFHDSRLLKSLKTILRPTPISNMPSHEPFMAIRAVDLRHELASRGLPTKGLKKDLAFRLAISENPCPFHALPHSTIALPSVASNQEVDLVTMHGSDIPTTEVKRRGPERSSPSRTDKSLPTSHDRQHGDDAWSIRSLVQISTTFNNALLWILLIVFLSCILWTYLPTVDKNYLVMRVNTGRDFVSSEINSGYRSLFRGVQSIGGINEAGENR